MISLIQICNYGDFFDGQCLTTTTPSPETTTTAMAEDIGELIIIFDADKEMAHWCYSQLDLNNGGVGNYDQTLTAVHCVKYIHHHADIDDDHDDNLDRKPNNCYTQQAMLAHDSQLIKIIPRNPRYRRQPIICISIH